MVDVSRQNVGGKVVVALGCPLRVEYDGEVDVRVPGVGVRYRSDNVRKATVTTRSRGGVAGTVGCVQDNVSGASGEGPKVAVGEKLLLGVHVDTPIVVSGRSSDGVTIDIKVDKNSNLLADVEIHVGEVSTNEQPKIVRMSEVGSTLDRGGRHGFKERTLLLARSGESLQDHRLDLLVHLDDFGFRNILIDGAFLQHAELCLFESFDVHLDGLARLDLVLGKHGLGIFGKLHEFSLGDLGIRIGVEGSRLLVLGGDDRGGVEGDKRKDEEDESNLHVDVSFCCSMKWRTVVEKKRIVRYTARCTRRASL